MENVIELHKNDLKAGEQKLKKLPANTNDWWAVKEKLKMYHIAYSQALNLAVQMFGRESGMSVEDWHLHFYKLLTEPYRVHKDQFRDGTKKSKTDETIVNIDNEI